MYSKLVEVGSGSTFSGITAVQLKGAVAHVDGTAGNYAHAIVITEANGLARSQIYYSAHTGDAKYIKEGGKRRSAEVIADNVYFGDSKPKDGGEEDDIPAYTGAPDSFAVPDGFTPDFGGESGEMPF